MTTSRRAATWLRLLALGVLAVSCGGSDKPQEWPKPKPPSVKQVAEQDGFVIRVREGSPPAAARPPLARATPLDDAATQALMARLPAMAKSADDEKGFALREGSKPPPKTGKV